MNTMTILCSIIAIIIYGFVIYDLAIFPKKVFVSIKKQLLKSFDHEKQVKLLFANDADFDNYSLSIWNHIQDRAFDFLYRKRSKLIEIIFVKGGIKLLACSFMLCLVVFPNDLGFKSILSETFLKIFLFTQIPIFLFSYFWHSRRFEKYMTIGQQEKILEEAKNHIKEQQDKAFNKYLPNHM